MSTEDSFVVYRFVFVMIIVLHVKCVRLSVTVSCVVRFIVRADRWLPGGAYSFLSPSHLVPFDHEQPANNKQWVTFLYSSEAVFNYLANEYKLNWEPEWRINVLTQFSCFSLNLQKAVCEKEVSDNQENNNIYLLIHRLYISWYNSDIILLAKIL